MGNGGRFVGKEGNGIGRSKYCCIRVFVGSRIVGRSMDIK